MSEWVESPLSQLATFQKGRKVDTSPFNADGYAPYLGASGLEGGDDGFAATRLAVIAKNTDTLMLWDGERSGLVGYGRQGVVASTVSKLSPSDKVEPKYLYYALSERFDWIQHRRTGTGVPHVPKDLGRLLKLCYPRQRTIQQRIATILTGIDTAIEKTEALIAKYQQIKAGLMHDLFTRGVLPNGQLRPPREQAPELYQEAVIGWIPREWRVKRLDEVAQVARGKFTHRPRNDPAYYGGNYPFIQTGDVSAAEGGFLSVHSQTLSALGTTVSQCFPEGTIAITIAANIADTAILAVPMYFPDSVVGAVVQQGVNVRFVELCIRRAKRRLDAMATQSAQKNINLQDLRPLLIPYPESGEQNRIANLFTAIQSKLDSEVSTREKLRAKKRGLMHDLLTGKVLVNIENKTTTTEALE